MSRFCGRTAGLGLVARNEQGRVKVFCIFRTKYHFLSVQCLFYFAALEAQGRIIAGSINSDLTLQNESE